MKIGFVQFEPRIGQREENLAAIEKLATEGADADLLVFPELATSGYDFADRDDANRHAETFAEGETSELALRLAHKHETTLVIGYPEQCSEGLYNAALIALPDGSLYNYRKLHLYSREKLLFIPGDAPPPVIETPHARVGIMICFDWIFPETARVLALRGAQIIAHPSNLVLEYCQRAMYCRSVENRVFIITANRVGSETNADRRLDFTGASQIVSPDGDYLLKASEKGTVVKAVKIDPAEADVKSINEFNDLITDRRVEHYGALQPGLLGASHPDDA